MNIPSPVPKLSPSELLEQCERWVRTFPTGNPAMDQGLIDAERYFAAHPGTLTELSVQDRSYLVDEAISFCDVMAFTGFSKSCLPIVTLLLKNGALWPDDPLSRYDIVSDPHPAMEWLEAFKRGGNLRANEQTPLPEEMGGRELPLWQALALKAMSEPQHHASLKALLAWARGKGMPVEAAPQEAYINLCEIFEIVRDLNKSPLTTMRLLMHEGIDAMAFCEKAGGGLIVEAYRDIAHLCAKTFLKGEQTRGDFEIAVAGGELPWLVREMAKDGQDVRLMQACETLSPYYREKYRYTLASLPRMAAVEESALAGYARGGAA